MKHSFSVSVWMMNLAILATLGSCSTPLLEGTKLNVQIEGATLPIWVRGNVDSHTAVIFIAGGPGNSGQMFAVAPAFQELERDYALVYWDQRFSGSTRGNPSDATITMEQFAADLDAVVTVIQDQFHFSSLFLMGHSFGGAVGTEYLLDTSRQAKIQGWISIDGAHNLPLANRLCRQSVWDYGQAYLKSTPEGTDAAYWHEALNFVAENPVVTKENASQIQSYTSHMEDFHFYLDEVNTMTKALLDNMLLASPIGVEVAQANYLLAVKNWGAELGALDYTPRMSGITLPSLILWGANDVIFVPALAQDAYEHLGTPSVHKSIVLFDQSGHDPMISARTFAAVVRDFVARYANKGVQK